MKRVPTRGESFVTTMSRGRILFGVVALVCAEAGAAGKPPPSPLPEPLRIESLSVQPSGDVTVWGRKVNLDRNTSIRRKLPSEQFDRAYEWEAANRKWQQVGTSVARVTRSPHDPNFLAGSIGGGFCISSDGGATWNKKVPLFAQVNGQHVQLGHFFWPTQSAGTVLFSENTLKPGARVFSLDLATSAITVRSTIPKRITTYARVGSRHFARLGNLDEAEFQCVASTDDGLTWSPVSTSQSPWALMAAAHGQLATLVPNAKEKKLNPVIGWAVDLGAVAFCGIHLIEGTLATCPPDQAVIFASSDRGKTWAPASMDKRSKDVRALFARCPILYESNGTMKAAAVLAGGFALNVEFDPHSQTIFAGMGGEWYMATLPSAQWTPLNTLPTASASIPPLPAHRETASLFVHGDTH